MLDVVVTLALVGLWAFSLFDAVTSDPTRVRRLPKLVWIVLVVLLPDVGAVAWLLLGRPQREYVPADTKRRRRVLGPEDAPDFEERIRRGMRREGPGDSDSAG